MLLTLEEKKAAENVKAALMFLKLYQYKNKIYKLKELIDLIIEKKKKIQNRLDELDRQATSFKRRDDLFKNFLETQKSEKILIRGWLAYLIAAILEDKKAQGDKFRFMESEPARAFREICRNGFYYDYDTSEQPVNMPKDKSRLQRVRSFLEPEFAAALISKKNKDLPGEAGAKAKFCIYKMYKKGEGLPKDYESAKKFLEEAADAGVADANYELAKLYKKGSIEYRIEKDIRKAYEYYKKASMLFPIPKVVDDEWKSKAATGNPIAQYICAKKELSKENIEFCAEAAKIAHEGRTLDNRRYYKAAREHYLYSVLDKYRKKIIGLKEQLKKDGKTAMEKRRKNAEKLCAGLIKETSPYEPFTKEEEAVLEEMKKELKL